MIAKNEKLKQANIDKIALFLNKKYNKVFKDKEFTIDILKQEISKLLLGKDMKTFNFNESIKKIEKSILKKVSNYGEIKCEPIQMAKINDLISYNSKQIQENNENKNNRKIPAPNNRNIKAPNSANNRINSNSQKRLQSAVPQTQNLNLENIKKDKNNNANVNINGNVKKNNEIPYPTEKMEKLKEREKNKWAIQVNKEHEQFLKEQEQLKKTIYEKKLKQRELLEQQIKEKNEKKIKMREEEKCQPYLASLNFGDNNININNNINNNAINRQNDKIKRPLSSKPLNQRKNEEDE